MGQAFAKITLFILSRIYGLIAHFRNQLYAAGVLKSYASVLPVISIGNLSAGGNAKTPLCLFLAEALLQKGLAPVVLLRGYKGKLKRPHLVADSDGPEQVGDEACLFRIAGRLPVVVARDRVLGSRFIEQKKLGNVIILDDGFQHRRLRRNIDIVSVNVGSSEAIESFVEGRLLPLGRFREARDEALQRADVVIFSERRFVRKLEELDPRLFRLIPPDVQIYRSYLEPAGLISLKNGVELTSREVAAFCGIANPESFISTLREMGLTVVGSRTFPDHYVFKEGDIEALRQQHPGAALVCTAKDAVKILPAWADGVYALNVRTKVVPADAFVLQISRMLLK